MNSSASGSRSRLRNGEGSMALNNCISSETRTSISSQFAGIRSPAANGDLLDITGLSRLLMRSLTKRGSWSRPRLLRVREWQPDDMLGHEPCLQLVAPNDVAHDQIVGSVIAAVRSEARHRS